MKILKASAGSGKTYRLSKTYLSLLLGSRSSDDAYRHILAVTFTNKATAEMKGRIVRDLAVLSETDARARRVLRKMLHDYGAFSVSTIDKFFQQTLKAFSREIGQFADYQIELDKDSLVRETMDRILDSMTSESKELLEWLKAYVSESLGEGVKPKSFDRQLYEIGSQLKSEGHRIQAEKYGIDDISHFSPERLSKVRKECSRIIREFSARAREAGVKVENGVRIKPIGKRLLAKNPAFAEYAEREYPRYLTAYIIYENSFSLGLAGEFYRSFDALLKEKNLMCIDDSNTILRDIINGSDAPFVYEKLGVRYEHFLLDEFQDTSNIQWQNFLPLLRESESKAAPGPDSVGSLIVGDVKQSIYRFRDSDWSLLGRGVQQQFPDADVETLDCNWRSAREVVRFNNAFFTHAASRLGVGDIYSDVSQKVRASETQGGYVRVSFSDDQMEEILASVVRARENGALWGDIAILVRTNSCGADIADYLIDKSIPVISDDSLNMKSSSAVRRIIALLEAYENPDDSISAYLAQSMDVTLPESYHSLVDFCESLIRSVRDYDPESFEGETLFIQTFMDELQDWTAANGNNLKYFLQYWDEKDHFISSPEDSDAVRILTVHKSKGLEFPYVIFPFAEAVTLYKKSDKWCRLDFNGRGGEPSVLDGIYPVALFPYTADSLFADSYEEEARSQIVDNLNAFYVALTRAGKSLHIIAKPPSKKFIESLGKVPDYSRMTDLLYEFVRMTGRESFGEEYDFSSMERREGTAQTAYNIEYASVPPGGRLSASTDALDFFGEDGLTGAGASVRLKGVVLHRILSAVVCAEDVEAAVEAEIRSGALDTVGGAEALELLGRRVASHPEWFPASREGRTAVYNEQSIFSSDGREFRPDRAVVGPDGVRVVDFKFGRRETRYRSQVANYASLYRSLGHNVVSAAIWYVEDDETEFV